jgi:hypothetical protein
VNKSVLGHNKTSLMRFDAKKADWVQQDFLTYAQEGKSIELAVPRGKIGLKGKALHFDFHWCDNPADLKDAISLCVNGDSAPNRRFNYRCIWNAEQ